MSVLQEIINNMAIDPELLAELSEEQKQMIFCKIREEQVRRWKKVEDELEKDEKKKSNKLKPKKNGSKNIGFLSGSDGNEWVWVMGEHKKDKSMEQILQKEAHEKARILAEKEAEELKQKEEEEVNRKMAEDEASLEKELKDKEEEEKRKQEEMAIYQSVKEAKKAFEKMEKERKQREEEEKKKITKIKTVANRELEEVKRRDSKRRSRSGMVDSRSSEYFDSIQLRRKKLEMEAEESQKNIDLEWQKQEERAKAREKEMKEIARRARETHKNSVKQKLKAVTHMIGLMGNAQENPPLPPKRSPQVPRRGKVRPAKPSDRNAVRQWFIEDERPHNIGINKSTELPHDWFHGIIKRQDAEKLLADQLIGSFLVRVSERVWGYAISYKDEDRFKHFLIDSSEGKYQFFGIDQIVHNTLNDLVTHHVKSPISELGQEYLQKPVAQSVDPPDYYELFSDLLNKDEVTHF